MTIQIKKSTIERNLPNGIPDAVERGGGLKGHALRKRQKTNKEYSVLLFDEAKEILKYFEKMPKGTDYIFPIFTPESQSEKQKTYRVAHVSRQVNKRLRDLAKLAKINRAEEITMYYTRHSFATILHRSGESVDIIRDLLGHTDSKTTEAYLKSFDYSELDKAAKKIL